MKLMQSLLAAAMVMAAHPVFAQTADTYPNKPVKVIVPFSAGSASDTVARILSDALRSTMGVMVIDNRVGANGIIGVGAAAKAPADGYTLLLTSSATHSGIGALYKNPGYDPLQDFVHISRISTIPMLLVTRTDAPFKTARDLADQARKSPLRYGYGSGSAQIAGAVFSTIAGAPSEGIPYKGQPPAVTDLMGGQIDYVLADSSVVTAFLQSGRLNGLAITGAKRSPELPHVPTMAEAGYKDFDLVVWVGLAAPAGTPAKVVERWNQALNHALKKPAVMEKLKRLGMQAAPNTVQEQAAFTQAQRDVWVARATAARIEQQ